MRNLSQLIYKLEVIRTFTDEQQLFPTAGTLLFLRPGFSLIFPNELIIFSIDADKSTWLNAALQQAHCQRIEDVLLNSSFQRACTKLWIIPLAPQVFLGGVRKLQCQFLLFQSTSECFKLDIHNHSNPSNIYGY